MKERINLNSGWLFANGKYNLSKKNFNDKASPALVNLPHIVERAEPDCAGLKKGVYWYRRDLLITAEKHGKKVILECEGIMNSAVVYVNGKEIGMHAGGYSEFAIDLTPYLIKPKTNETLKNTLAIKVKTDMDKDVPIGKPEQEISFLYYGGIYRNINIVFYDNVHISNNMLKTSKAESGIYIADECIAKDKSIVNVRANVINHDKHAKDVKVCVQLLDADGCFIESFNSQDLPIAKGKDHTFVVPVKQSEPKLWSPNYPYLYYYVVEVFADGEKVDQEIIRRGLRTIKADYQGVVINGANITLRGINRHEQMPYIGNAISEEMAYRDAFKIKKAGFNLVKLGFYQQSRHFISACDELGLLTMNVCSAYQRLGGGEFRDIYEDSIRTMARRDRNATSVAIWQATPSQTSSVNSRGASDKYFGKLNAIIKEELCHGAKPLIAGDIAGRKKAAKMEYDIPYCQSDYATKQRHLKALPNKKGLVVDYGDYEFGGEDSTSRTSRDNVSGMLMQAWNMQWQHNRNLGGVDVLGDVVTEAFDHNGGPVNGNSVYRSGIMDQFRLPKYSYEFYKSQDARMSAKTVFAATNWDNRMQNDLVVYSNCTIVRVYINGRFVTEKSADCGETVQYVPYKKKEIAVIEKNIARLKKGKLTEQGRHWALPVGIEEKAGKTSPIVYHLAKTFFDGNNCDKLQFPPFTFKDIEYEAGELKVEGLINGEVVATQIIKTPGEPSSIRIKTDYSNRALVNDGSDAIIVHAEIIDAKGAVVNNCEEIVKFVIEGGVIVGGVEVKCLSGIASTLIKANYGSEQVIISAISSAAANTQKVGVALDKQITKSIN